MLDRRIFKFKGARRALSWLALLTLIQAVAIIFQGRFLSVSLSDLWGKKTLNQVALVLGIFITAFVVRQCLTVAKNYVLVPFADRTTDQLQKSLIEKYTKLGPTVISNNGTGKSVNLAIEGIGQVNNYLTLVLIKFVDMSIVPWLILVYMASIKWEQALFLFIIYPIIVLFMIILGYTAQAKADREYDRFNRLSNHFVDTLRGLTTLKQLGLSKRYANNVYEVSEDYRKATLSTLSIGILSTFALDFLTTLSIAVVALFLGLDLMNGNLTLVSALTILILAPEYFLPIRNFANDYHATLDGKNALADIFDILDQPETKNQDAYQPKQAAWQADSTLALQNVNYTYPKTSQLALQNISMEIKGFEKVGLVGTSGSGKSTLLNLLGGFIDGEGEVKIEGEKVPHLSQKAWQQNLQFMPQDPYIFHDTVRANLAFYAPEVTDVQIEKVIDQVGLQDWFNNLTDGLDTIIGDGAMQTSGGQAQRIALARIMLNESRRVILLDEPTAHLDIETEMQLKQTMLPIFENHLVIFATHRLHWLAQMDWIIVMKDGQIVEQGTLAELNANNGYFVELQKAMQGAEHE
ncbi:ABC membrane transporter (ATP-binding protein) required for cytochrome bb' function [Weissella viridescens]|uniref:thiol reductant ABC exporter subunit CydD n=1 Tax=Weissella viridescens TaxID=1629 RepID=UPI00092F044A|nr:thiol reductant ABC exporter subunit CydD [Weissella viridescens]SOB44285.1 ABC membrane transporter (ATP-binding protein) required for cytochrome bb' function [Weissella viridescens]